MVKLMMAGYQNSALSVNVQANSITPVSVTLIPLGAIEVTTRLDGAQVTIDGIPSGSTPVTIRGLKDGYHIVQVSMPGYRDYRGRVRVVAGKTTSLKAPLVPLCEITVTSNLKGAKVTMDDIEVGSTPLVINNIPGGIHVISVSMDGFRTYTTKFAALAGKRVQVNVNLKSLA